VDLHFSRSRLQCGQGDVIELSMSFWRDLPLHADQTFSLDAKSNWGGPSYCTGGQQPCERATSGSIHSESFSQERGANGLYEPEFPKLGGVSGPFQTNGCKMRVVRR
jgi:hypothetical protein